MPTKAKPGRVLTEVIGFVHGGAGGAPSDSGAWVLAFQLKPWRRVGRAIEEGELQVEQEVSEEALGKAMGRFDDGVRVHLLVEMTDRRVFDSPLAILVRDLGAGAESAELDAALVELRKPMVIGTARLGQMVFNRQLARFEGDALLAGHPCKVLVSRERKTDDLDADGALLETAADQLEVISEIWPRLLEPTVARMYALYTRVWSAGEPVSAERFRDQLKPKRVSINPGGITVFLDAAGLFRGHSIEVRLSPTGHFMDAGLA